MRATQIARCAVALGFAVMMFAAVMSRQAAWSSASNTASLEELDHIQVHLRGEGVPGTGPGTVPTGAKLVRVGPAPFFRWTDNPMERIEMALKQGCQELAPTYDIVTDRNLGCQNDQVAFYHDEFGPNTAYWMCYRCLLVYTTQAPTTLPPPTKAPVPLPESCF